MYTWYEPTKMKSLIRFILPSELEWPLVTPTYTIFVLGHWSQGYSHGQYRPWHPSKLYMSLVTILLSYVKGSRFQQPIKQLLLITPYTTEYPFWSCPYACLSQRGLHFSFALWSVNQKLWRCMLEVAVYFILVVVVRGPHGFGVFDTTRVMN